MDRNKIFPFSIYMAIIYSLLQLENMELHTLDTNMKFNHNEVGWNHTRLCIFWAITLINAERKFDSCDGNTKNNYRCCVGQRGEYWECLTEEAMCRNELTGGWSDPASACQNGLALGIVEETRQH